MRQKDKWPHRLPKRTFARKNESGAYPSKQTVHTTTDPLHEIDAAASGWVNNASAPLLREGVGHLGLLTNKLKIIPAEAKKKILRNQHFCSLATKLRWISRQL